jgi:hypothetical protein
LHFQHLFIIIITDKALTLSTAATFWRSVAPGPSGPFVSFMVTASLVTTIAGQFIDIFNSHAARKKSHGKKETND